MNGSKNSIETCEWASPLLLGATNIHFPTKIAAGSLISNSFLHEHVCPSLEKEDAFVTNTIALKSFKAEVWPITTEI